MTSQIKQMNPEGKYVDFPEINESGVEKTYDDPANKIHGTLKCKECDSSNFFVISSFSIGVSKVPINNLILLSNWSMYLAYKWSFLSLIKSNKKSNLFNITLSANCSGLILYFLSGFTFPYCWNFIEIHHNNFSLVYFASFLF